MASLFNILEMRAVLTAAVSMLVANLPSIQAQSSDISLFFDPGPNYLCYNFSSDTSTYYDWSECATIGAGYPPAWTMSWFRADEAFNGVSSGGDGRPITVTLIDNAQDVGDCDLHETFLSYDYPGVAIHKLPNGDQYNLSSYDQWVVEYDVTVHPDDTDCPDCTGCGGYNRKYLETDFIYYWTACSTCPWTKNLISIIHYNPITTKAALGPYQEDGYRIQINGPPTLTEGVKAHVALDFKAILVKYINDLCHDGVVPYEASLYSLQIVSSNVNTSSTIDIENVQLSLLITDNPTTYPMPSYPIGDTPSYCPQSADPTSSSPSTTTTSTPPPGSQSGCYVHYNVTSSWSSGYTVDMHLTNTGSFSVSKWELDWVMPSGQTVSSWWSADFTQTGEAISVTSSDGSAIASQSTVDFGFNAGGTFSGAPSIPSAFTMNGVSCTVN